MEKDPVESAAGSSTSAELERDLGARVRELRVRRGLTQAELARLANIDRTTVVRVEQGEGGTITTLVRIARALGRNDWLNGFAPPRAGVSPMLLREQRLAEAARRNRGHKSGGLS
jgi:transcriptional regulator with XRE-family HTH domain